MAAQKTRTQKSPAKKADLKIKSPSPKVITKGQTPKVITKGQSPKVIAKGQSKVAGKTKPLKVMPKGQAPTKPSVKAAASKSATKNSKLTASIEKRMHAVEEQSGKIFNSATEVARSLKSKAKEAVDVVEKAVEKASGRATQALRSVEAALEARKTVSTRKADALPEIQNIVQKMKGTSPVVPQIEEAEVNASEDESQESSEAKTKAKKLQVFRSRAERLKVERLISDNHQPVQKRWAAIYDQLKHLKASAYDMTGQFDLKTPVVHKVLGWGFIVDIRDSRMDVMFKDGLKTLIMNYRR